MLKALCPLIVIAGALFPLSARGAEMSLAKDDVGQLWLQIIGRIDDSDDVKFKEVLMGAINRGEQITHVSIYSPGGQSSAAMRIGRYVRAMHLTTVAPVLVPILGRRTCDVHVTNGRAIYLEYDPVSDRGDPRCTCARECFLIWVAGTTRLGNAVQIHHTFRREDDGASLSDSQAADADAANRVIISRYLQDMGVPKMTAERMFDIGADNIDYLTKEERDVLSLQIDRALFIARCALHVPTSPAALACENAVTRELYWEGARKIMNWNE